MRALDTGVSDGWPPRKNLEDRGCGFEKGRSGALHRDYRDCCNLVVLYRWPELKLPDSTTGEDGTSVYVTTSELTQREKAEVLRAHVNLGHPHPREFVRLLKAAGPGRM